MPPTATAAMAVMIRRRNNGLFTLSDSLSPDCRWLGRRAR
jgi:hypothetical protein